MSSRSRLTLAQLRLFLAVVRAGGFGEAAAEQGLSQSSLSEGVAKLERALGVRLLRRASSGVTLTAAGTRMLQHAERALQAVADIHEAVQEPDQLTGTLRIAAPRSVATHLLPQILARFRSTHPGINLQVIDAGSDHTSGEEFLLSGHVDIAIVHMPVAGPLLNWPFYQDDYKLVVSESSSASQTAAEIWQQLTNQPLLLPMTCVRCNRLLQTYLNQHAASTLTVLEVENDSAMLGMVAHGLGHAIIPHLATQPLPQGVRLLGLPVPLRRQLAVAVMPSRAALPMIRALTTLLHQQALVFSESASADMIS
ncbi:LysR family transcriptional regulator [Deinococcus humi]|uniref:DNA-binding transcriptional LysR family regulator n=1 Tax=Deinococcus humi TaxID=662880 RepID=A0A7W8NEM8_9DEIO|nr:LysR family transcriptional regulator [Deinococcus humi]MBB5363511.1 DNA-binding transcriptional LysR family regulator [Deinococcus humi]GGO30438.1 transcriptional regulator [Deinococcus humi]